jgi:hypothetical protein
MEITGKLDIQFFNFGHDHNTDPDNTNGEDYLRVEGTWNIYYHGFMDARCDIAYVKQRTVLQPGIYEINTYGIDAYLFFWQGEDRLRGLITQRDNQPMIDDAYKKYLKQVSHL